MLFGFKPFECAFEKTEINFADENLINHLKDFEKIRDSIEYDEINFPQEILEKPISFSC